MNIVYDGEKEGTKQPSDDEDAAGFLKDRENLDNTDSKDNQPPGVATDLPASHSYLGPEKSLYTKSDDPKRSGFWRGPSGGKGWRRKRVAVTAAVLAATAAVSIAIFLALLPFKILHIVNNLQSRFTASAQNAVGKETDALFSTYIRKYILPAHRQCGVIIDAKCNPIPTSTNPVTRLYKGWRNAKFEDKIAQKYGIEFGYNSSSHKYFMKAPVSTNEIDLTDFVENNPENLSLDEWIQAKGIGGLKSVDLSEIRQEVKDATAGETLWKRTYIRFKFRRFLNQKYGIPNCIWTCTGKDALAGFVNDQKVSAKIALNRLVLLPRDKALGIVMECVLTNCDPTKDTTVPCAPGEDCELNNAPANADTDTPIRQSLEDLAAKYEFEDVASLESLYKQVVADGITQIAVERTLATFLDTDVAKATAQSTIEALSIVGWLLLANQIANAVNFTNNANVYLKKLDYVVNAAAAVNLFGVYRVYADEAKTGQVNATEVGSLSDSLGAIASTASLTDLKGGTASAEQAPLYSYLIDNQSPAHSPSYKCDDGSTPAATNVQNSVCPEEVPGAVNIKLLQQIHDGLSNPSSPFYILGQMARVWSAIRNAIPGLSSLLSFINGAFGSLISIAQPIFDRLACFKVGPITIDPVGYCAIKNSIQAGIKQVGNLLASLIPNPFSINMSGARTFDLMAAGADVSGNEYAHNGLGGKRLTPQQAADNYNQQALEDYQQYKHESFFAQMFDTNSNYSPVSKLAMALPANKTAAMQSIGSMFSNPFSKIAGAFGSIFGSSHAFAAVGAQADPFNIVQYGYTNDDPKLITATKDPEAYWQQNCADGQTTANWNQASIGNLDPNTQMPVNDTTNPCLLIESSVGADGALFDPSLLTQDDLGSQ